MNHWIKFDGNVCKRLESFLSFSLPREHSWDLWLILSVAWLIKVTDILLGTITWAPRSGIWLSSTCRHSLLPATRESSIPLSSPVSNDDTDLVVHRPPQDRRHRDTHLSRGANRWTGMLKAEEPILARNSQKWHLFHAHILNSRCILWAHCKELRQKLVL